MAKNNECYDCKYKNKSEQEFPCSECEHCSFWWGVDDEQ